MIISDLDLGTVCDQSRCTAQAVYVCTATNLGNASVLYVRLYCPDHMRELVEGLAKLLARQDIRAQLPDGFCVHDCLEVEHLVVGARIDA